MELKDFIRESLTQILDGIVEAQKHTNGGHVAAAGYYGNKDNALFHSNTGLFTVVDFDVSVAAETKEGGGSIRVSSVEAHDGTVRAAQNSSRVKFSVPVKIPEGDPDPRKNERSPRRGYAPGVV